MRDHEKASSTMPKNFVRFLGAFEEIYWLYSRTAPRGFAYAIEVSGATTIASWRAALAAVKDSQPLFSVFIDPNEGGIPFFRRAENAAIPMRILKMEGACWQEEMAREIHTPFSGDEKPLLRSVLIQGPDNSIFILAAHHSISDGASMSAAMVDLFSALNGDGITPHAVLPPVEEALGVPRVKLSAPLPPLPPNDPPLAFRDADTLPPTIESRRLGSDLTTKLVERARQERTTVHGALCSAIVAAGRQGQSTWSKKAVRVLSNIDTRRRADFGTSSALYFGAGILPISPEITAGFWQLARIFTDSLKLQTSREALEIGAKLMTTAVVEGLDEVSVREFLAHALAFEVIVSNVGRITPKSQSKIGTLTSMWGSSFVTGAFDEQIVGVTTINAHLHLLYTSYTPISSLLANVEALLTAALQG
jgi:hypothetical protein